MSALFAIVHHLLAFAMITALAMQLALLRTSPDGAMQQRIVRLDVMYAASATLVLIIGLVRVFGFEKGWAYYSMSVPFWLKISAFVVVAIVSFGPTREFNSWKKQLRSGATNVPSDETLRWLRRAKMREFLGIAVILISAALMARGYGTF
jgi:putative membrane protein